MGPLDIRKEGSNQKPQVTLHKQPTETSPAAVTKQRANNSKQRPVNNKDIKNMIQRQIEKQGSINNSLNYLQKVFI